MLPASTYAAEPRPGWDDDAVVPPAPAPASAPAPPPTTTAPVASTEVPSASPISDERLQRQRRNGNALWVGAVITAGLATVFNGWRASIVSGPCQTDNESAGCELAWHLTTPLTWGLNVGSIALAGAGAGVRGRYDATVDAQRHAERRSAMVTAGTTLLVAGFLASVTLRSLWFSDWVEPHGRETFDFSRRSHAFGYYGGLQLSSMAIGAGVAMLVHSTRRAPRIGKRPAPLLVMPSGAGLQLVGRF
jgi:hypothetical protein